ncbi:Late Golgi vesicles protein [Komagataella phaffii CBS 7435]|uniref:Late Golgi vesicles protein n=1 Tax=Komagataella phaffii (strain ATCC 76273 / CBS 7435 / CECT 11047 / NRRL Y-11430 / Wegner 21-1) TaxID=981350 RepID=F2QU03_KOMPC|nr:Late Golgi vesicles protein [Komagataella phaffii CBS 7435]CCA38881.1 Late Golgi vesicles protein [Komagataella phaffii CBS 7435]
METEQNYNSLFKAANLFVAGATIFAGALQLLNGLNAFLLSLFIIAFGGVIAALEIKPELVPKVTPYLSFLLSFLGRGGFYIFLGVLISGGSIFRGLIGFLLVIVGVGFVSLEFVGSIEPPPSMREVVSFEEEDII